MKNWINRMISLVLTLSLTASMVFATDYTAETAHDFFAYLQAAFEGREEEFTITFDGDTSALSDTFISLSTLQRELMAQLDPSANGDYVALNLDNGNFKRYENQYIFRYMEYLEDEEETAFVTAQVEKILTALDLDHADDLEKIISIYQYMTDSFTYDNTLSIFSAYEGLSSGTMVCQGFALLTSRLLEGAGLNARIVCGQSRDLAHAWNMVEYDGLWYNLDTTWDCADETGGIGSWNFFMKNQEDFKGHEAFDQFTSAEFMEAHPMADDSYPLEAITITSDDSPVSGLVIRLGIEVELGTILPQDSTDDTLVWTSGDPDILEVQQDGTITAIGIGSTYLSVSSEENPHWLGCRLNVTTVDMTTLSPWSSETVTEYYLNQMLPTDLCCDYQNDMTRLDLAILVDYLLYKNQAYDLFSVKNPFGDISNLSTVEIAAILRMYGSGVMIGNADNQFDPDSIVTRQEVATVLMRALDYLYGVPYENQGVSNFTDGDTIATWAQYSVVSAQEQEILIGDDLGNFNPLEPMTREEAIVACSRIYNQFKG